MGEIRIKSGNLANGELEQGGVLISGSIVSSAARVRGYANVKPLTAYTITANKAFRLCYGYNYDGLNFKGVGLIFDNNSGNNKLSTFTTPERCNYIRFVMWNGDESNIVPTDIQNLILVEGTYTSETIPEYQPYFLNRPAHQYVNGEWIDIPTHKYTNNRWQGELTSQSPLKFRADGEMLDWRVEGRTSGNLFDVKHFVDTAYCHNVVLTQLDNGMKIQATSSNDPYVNYVNGVIGQTLPIDMRSAVIPCKPNTDYALHCDQSSRIGKYLSYFDKNYKVVKNYTPFSGTLLNFKTPDTCVFILLRLGDSSTLSKGTTIELTNIQLLEGTYTTSTIPPYEPYGGVGDWDETEQKYVIPMTINGVTTNLYTTAQLMDGDSIDYTTDQTQIPIVTGNNTLTVDTAVQPKSVFVKFEG